MTRYIYSKDNKTIVCLQTSKGELFKGIARCNDSDEINLELGALLAQARCELAIRERDLKNIRIAKEFAMTWSDHTPSCKLYTLWYQQACGQEKAHLKHIRKVKKQIRNLCNGIMF